MCRKYKYIFQEKYNFLCIEVLVGIIIMCIELRKI